MKILILGNGGSGKSYLAGKLAAILHCEPTHVDKLYWRKNWEHLPVESWETALHAILSQQTWVMEGTPMRDLALRIAQADFVIFLDTPKYICILRVIMKGVLTLFSGKNEKQDGCPVRGISLHAIRWIWKYTLQTKPNVLHCISTNTHTSKIIFLKNKRETAKFIHNFYCILSHTGETK